ncbi:hypothetical protein EGR_08379 [Echinococcus granulosus]|uniref:Uncharacterized protein n=1 Tax=Echinococcus granulosus TaxID=6210 RepID=W6U8J7_ECHGR|nr:hypothetical protein EGR_08379 [Echinococcus granulosus]EUB56736.1 hypothetical protein EGR_08379 [Echinococcus granulosus]
MDNSSSALLIPPSQRLNGADIYNCSYKKQFPTSHRLASDFEKNEATLVAEGAAQSTRLFRNNMRMLQRRNIRNSKVLPTTAVTTVATAVMKSETPRYALMKVYEEEEEEVVEMKKEDESEDLMEPSATNNRLSHEAFLQVRSTYLIWHNSKVAKKTFTLETAKSKKSRSREQLAPPETLLSQTSTTHTVSELKGALSTALARNARLLEQRRTQTTQYLQLQRQADSLSAELDASVDNLRHQRSRWEAEKLRSSLEARELRQQLAEALAALQTTSHCPPNSSTPVHQVKGGQSEGCTLCEQRNLEVSALRIAVERLEGEMARQRRGAEQEAAQWAVQLADAAAENRSLRLQLSRSGNTFFLNSASFTGESEVEDSCINCRRLQQLVDVLQAKGGAGGVMPQPDVIPVSCEERVGVCEGATQTESIDANYPFKNEEKDTSLFELLESGGRINGLTAAYPKKQLGDTLGPQQGCKSPSPPPPPTPSHSGDASLDVSRLLERLHVLEAEVESSADQLKASNDEFLQLRERLTSATVEKAHLKATLDGLDDQVIQLEAALFERTEELRKCQAELSHYQNPQSCVLRLQDDFEALARSPPRTVLRQTSSQFKKVVLSYVAMAAIYLNRPLVAKMRECTNECVK